jgi:hypothetical protein
VTWYRLGIARERTGKWANKLEPTFEVEAELQ